MSDLKQREAEEVTRLNQPQVDICEDCVTAHEKKGMFTCHKCERVLCFICVSFHVDGNHEVL